MAYNEGVQHLAEKDQPAAERSFRKALSLWEDLTKRPDAPPNYRANLALSLMQLGYIRYEQKRLDDAESYLSRAAAVADPLVGHPDLEEETRTALAGPREALAALRSQRLTELLGKKDQAGQD